MPGPGLAAAGPVTFMRAASIVLVLALVASAEGAAEWKDTEVTTKIWQAVSSGDSGEVKKLLDGDDDIVNTRSADGRGALWWAYEADNDEIIDMLTRGCAQH